MSFSAFLLPLAITLIVLVSLWVTWPGLTARAGRPMWQHWVRWLIFGVNLVSGVLLLFLLLRIFVETPAN